MALSKALESLIEQGTSNALLYFGLANAYQREGAIDKAIEACRLALGLEPDYLDVILLKAQLELDANQDEQAIITIKQGLEQAEHQCDVRALAEFQRLTAR